MVSIAGSNSATKVNSINKTLDSKLYKKTTILGDLFASATSPQEQKNEIKSEEEGLNAVTSWYGSHTQQELPSSADDANDLIIATDEQKKSTEKSHINEQPEGFAKLLEKIKDSNVLSKVATEENSEIPSIEFNSNNTRKDNFIHSVLHGLTLIPDLKTKESFAEESRIAQRGEATMSDVTHMIKEMRESFCKDDYLSDLKTACNYLLRDRAINQGDKEFHEFIYKALITFETIDDLTKAKDYSEIFVICHKFNSQINRFSNSGNNKYGFKAAARGALIGASITGGVVAGGVADFSFMAVTFASLKSTVAALLAALGITTGVTLLAIALPVTGGLALGIAAGVGGYKGYQYYKDCKAENRLCGYLYTNTANK